MNYKAVLFDLDGTLLDTTADLASSMNWAMNESGHRHDYTPEEAAIFFGSGVTVAIQRALAYEKGSDLLSLLDIGKVIGETPEGIDPAEVTAIEEIYRPYYNEHCDERTAPYDGADEMIATLRENGMFVSVVSNKPVEAVRELALKHFKTPFDVVIGESPEVKRKPAPDMLLTVLEVLGLEPSECVYVGDSEIDLVTSAATGMDCITVTWGFRPLDYLMKSGAYRIADTIDQLLESISE